MVSVSEIQLQVYSVSTTVLTIIIVTQERPNRFFAAHVPHALCSEQVKNDFWTLYDEKTVKELPEDTVVSRDSSGHTRVTKDGYRCLYSDTTKTMIDFVLTRHRNQELITEAKGVTYETVVKQLHPLICTMKSQR